MTELERWEHQSTALTPAEFAELRYLVKREAERMAREDARCNGKQKFPTPADARRSIRPRVETIVNVYRCNFCGSFHVGGVDRVRRLRRTEMYRRKRRIA